MNSGVAVHISRGFGGLKEGQPSLFWKTEQRLFEEATALVTPSRNPVSTSCRLTHSCKVWGEQPILGEYRLHRRPGRGILAAVFLHHAHRAFANFRGIFGCFSFVHHGSILLEKGASSKSGAVQSVQCSFV